MPATASSIALNALPTNVIDGIHVYSREDYNGWFENEYSTTAEPWAYSSRGAELNRHLYTLQQLKKYHPRPTNLLELGSSKGLMTVQLMQFCEEMTASDISVTAIKACKERCEAVRENTACSVNYFVTTTPGLPFAADSFDVVTIFDGMEGWWFPDDKKKEALEDIYRVLKKGGIAVLSDFFITTSNIERFAHYKSIIGNSALSIISVSHLYDRPWYLLESIAKKTHLQKPLQKILSSVSVAKLLNSIGKVFGRKMSNHIIIIAKKE